MRVNRMPVALVLVLAGAALAGDFEDGKALQQAGKFEEALPKFEAASKADPTNPEAALGLSQVLAGLGRYEEASKAVDAARKAHPDNAALPAAKGRAYFLLLMKEKAKPEEERDQALIDSYKDDVQKWAKAAMAVDAKNVEALLTMGNFQQEFGDPDQARINFELAAVADPKNFDAIFAVGEHYFLEAGKNQKNAELWAKAENAFFQATRLDPKSARAAANYAHCKAWQNEPGKEVAIAYLKAYELSSPPDEKLLGNAYKRMPPDDRADMCQQLADAAPNDVVRKLYLAYAYAAPPWKNYDKATGILDAASKLEPKNARVPLVKGDLLLQGGKVDDAIAAYQQAIELYGGEIDDETYGKLSMAPINTKGFADAQREKLWQALWKGFPKRAGAANNAGLFYRDAKRAKESLEWYLRAAEAAPEDCCIQNDTGLIYHYEMKQYDKAMPFYKKAIEIGKANGYDDNETRKEPDRGYNNAIDNVAKMLIAQKKWAELKAFANEVPEHHVGRALWLKTAEEKK